MARKKQKFYAIKSPVSIRGVYTDWEKVEPMIKGHKVEYKSFKSEDEANAYLTGKLKTTSTQKKYYVITYPLHLAKIYDSWEECQSVVSGVSNVLYKSFKSKEEAIEYYKYNKPSDDIIKNSKDKSRQETKKYKSTQRTPVKYKNPREIVLGSYISLEEAISEADYTSQTEAYLRLLNGDNVFITGPAGSGKSFVVQEYCKILQRVNPDISIVKTSTTGLSAASIEGITIHSFMGIGINKLSHEDYIQSLEQKVETELSEFYNITDISLADPDDVKETQREVYRNYNRTLKKLKGTDILIIDEISMMSESMFDFLGNMIKESGANIQLIVSGDFSQLPPVATIADIKEYGESIGNFCYKSKMWQEFNFTTCYLDKLYRAKDVELAKILNAISLGYGEQITKELNKLPTTTNKFKKGTALLLSTNEKVDKINLEEQSKNKGKLYSNKIKYIDEDSPTSNNYKKAVKLAKLANTPEDLTLKVGDTIMCTRNIKMTEEDIRINGQRNHPLARRATDLRNGMIGSFIVDLDGKWGIRLDFDEIQVDYMFSEPYKFITEPVMRKDRVTGEIYEEKSGVWYAQYPFKLAYAITIHKSQGQTFSHITIDLTRCWTEGLGYVALSRAMNISGITLLESPYGSTYNRKALQINRKSLLIKKDTQNQSKIDRQKYFQENLALLENLDDYINKKYSSKQRKKTYK